jgi:phosphatidylglycerophosphate synthase
VRHVRNVLIILALAGLVAFGPGGGNGAATVLTALTMGFFVAICALVLNLYRQNEMTLATLTDARRAILYGAVALIALLVAGTDEFFASGGGTLAWVVMLGAAVAAIWRIWQEASSY